MPENRAFGLLGAWRGACCWVGMNSAMRLASLSLLALTAGCGEQYCQMSAKSGTRCYNINEVEWQESQSRPPPPPERETQPAPGCALLTKEGVYLMPQDANQSQRPPSYLMSGACVTRRRPVPGLR